MNEDMEKYGFGKKDKQTFVISKQKEIELLTKEQDELFKKIQYLLDENDEDVINNEELEQLEYRVGYIGERISSLIKEIKIQNN